MNSFDILSRSTPLHHRLFLEASAGTGKTFTIEHLVIRLLLESDFQLEQILLVTFTRAATRELKVRIRSSLEKIRAGELNFDYLKNLTPLQRAKIDETLAAFDQAQIFTIHGFCHWLLQKFAFEAAVGLELKPWEEKDMTWEVLEFLRSCRCLTVQQQNRLLSAFRQDPARLKTLITSSDEPSPPTAEQLLQALNDRLAHLPSFSVQEAFLELRPHYKGMTPPEFDSQVGLFNEAVHRKSFSPPNGTFSLERKNYG